MDNFTKWLNILKQAAPVAALAIYEYLQGKIKKEEIQKQEVELTLAELQAKDANHAKFDGLSDDAVIDSISSGQDPK